MSLKGKIEAIIYAAEEPVTLEQLRSLLGGEAAALLDARAQQQRRLPLHQVGHEDLVPPSEPEELNDEVLDPPEMNEKAAGEQDDAVVDAEAADLASAPLSGEVPPPASGPAGEEPGDELQERGDEAREHGDASEEHSAEIAPAPVKASPPNVTSTAELTPSPGVILESGPVAAPDDKQQQRAARERERAVRELLREQLDELIRDYTTGDRGLEIREVANGFRLATRPEYHDAVRGFARSLKPPLKLSLQALETLAVVAYKQPVTAPEVGEIRGVDSGGVLGSLMARKLVVPAGRKQVVGRPILYKTTKEFLLRFGLRDVSELPSIEEFEKLAGELADIEPLQEEIPMSDDTSGADAITSANLRVEENSTEPQADGDGTTAALEATPIDGRMAGLTSPRNEPADPSEAEADTQRDQQAATEGTED